jgi:YidC/Oxa1 family membrane protein insertase
MMEQRNLIVAIALSLAIMLGFNYFYEIPRQKAQQQASPIAATDSQTGAPSVAAPPVPGTATTAPPAAGSVPTAGAPAAAGQTRAQILAATPRVRIDTPRVAGSISLVGGRIDDVTLRDYHETVDPTSPTVTLFNPPGMSDAYYGDFGWVAGSPSVAVPGADTRWTADQQTLSPEHPVTLSWDNGQGLRFIRQYAIDQNYMITVAQRVENGGSADVTLFPYGLISRTGTPPTLGYYILFEGMIGMIQGTLHEEKYTDLQKQGTKTDPTTGGWLGITDKYWLSALVPDQSEAVQTRFAYSKSDGADKYQADFLGDAHELKPGSAVEATTRLFAGAKEVRLLQAYERDLGIQRFDYAVDWGWFFFLTKPIFQLLDWFYHQVGNFGIAILLLTLSVKILFFPLANRSYRMMSKMKKLAPKMAEMKEKYGDDRAKINQEMMGLYKKEKVNPLSGCLPILLQIPVFFSLYKVLFVTIEMRHAPFYGWIHDLSEPDPTNIFTLFGLVPWHAPDMLHLGLWPLIMGATMFLQQRLNPTPTDPVQAKVFMFMPLMFMVMLAKFPSGLVIYWAWNNTLSVAQQWVIMRRSGAA